MMGPAASLITFAGAHEDDRFIDMRRLPVDQALGAAGRLAANRADGIEFGHFLGNRHQHRNYAKGFSPEVCVQASHDDPQAPVGKRLHRCEQFAVKELRLVNGNNRRVRLQLRRKKPGTGYLYGGNVAVIVTADASGFTKSIIKTVLEDLHLSPGDDRAPHSPD